MNYNLTAEVKTFLTDSHVNDDNHVVSISSSIPKGSFLAVTENSMPAESDLRTIKVQIMVLAQAEGGSVNIDTNPFVRGTDEKKVSVSLSDSSGKEVANCICEYGLL